MRYQSRTPERRDPTGDLAALAELIDLANGWVGEAGDPVERYRRRELVLDAQMQLQCQAAAPDSGRVSHLDEAFTAMGYRDGSRD